MSHYLSQSWPRFISSYDVTMLYDVSMHYNNYFPCTCITWHISSSIVEGIGMRLHMCVAWPSAIWRRNFGQFPSATMIPTLQWRHNEHDGAWNHQRLGCLLNDLFRRRSKKASKLHVTGLCEGNSPVIGEFPTQRANNAENVLTASETYKWYNHSFELDYSKIRTNGEY